MARTASDILLDLENKIIILTKIVQAQDLNIKALSNKLNELMRKDRNTSPAPRVEAVDHVQFNNPLPAPTPNVYTMIQPDNSLTVDNSPNGFRRTSRQETFTGREVLAGDDAYLPKNKEAVIQLPLQMPTLPKQSPAQHTTQPQESTKQVQTGAPGKKIPVMQRCVDKNGKSIFLADVEIINLDTSTQINRTRTDGAGKWKASLPIGFYRVILRRRESVMEKSLESIQDITVDGSQSPLTLPIAIIQ